MPSRPPFNIRQPDLDCLHRAQEILLQDLENPPSLLQLAQQVGLNDYKLKAGFRKAFGTTVFGWLHQQRMQQAYLLLQSSDLPITEIASQVGYTSPSAFSTAFKKFFGISPSSCRARDLQ
jgi:AraC family transcriptional regulator, transcriptional activator of the genes for pyochelin and ferripyochelin receptors